MNQSRTDFIYKNTIQAKDMNEMIRFPSNFRIRLVILCKLIFTNSLYIHFTKISILAKERLEAVAAS